MSPDILPEGYVKIEAVWIDEEPYSNFDAEGLTIKLPAIEERVKVKVRISPASGLEQDHTSKVNPQSTILNKTKIISFLEQTCFR